VIRYRDATPQDVPALVDIALERCRHAMAWWITGLFGPEVDLDVARVAESGDGPVGFATVTHRTGRPEHQRFVNVFVARDVEARRIGGHLFSQCVAGAAEGTRELWTQAFDDDERPLLVLERWGFERVQLSITSVATLDPDVARHPDPPDGVTLEPCGDLDPPDADAFDAMLTASQTNPEARSSHVITRAEMARWADEGEVPVGTLVRVDGAPAAVSFGGVAPADHIGGVGYTGVHPEHRGRGLAVLAKQHLHHQAAGLGITRMYTENEENNDGIRRVNATLGYVPEFGLYRLRRRVGDG
jgi:GNAT superfamily N-acetyltransferase